MLVGYVNLRYKKAKTKTIPMAGGGGRGVQNTREGKREWAEGDDAIMFSDNLHNLFIN